jgi:hypothetical protein
VFPVPLAWEFFEARAVLKADVGQLTRRYLLAKCAVKLVEYALALTGTAGHAFEISPHEWRSSLRMLVVDPGCSEETDPDGSGGNTLSRSWASTSVANTSPRSIAEYRVVLIPTAAATSCCRSPAAIRRSFQLSACFIARLVAGPLLKRSFFGVAAGVKSGEKWGD